MFNLTQKLRVILFGVMFGASVSVPVAADDIEIYTSAGTTSATTQANVLFVLDTSGSMDTKVVTQAAYDPTVDYSGGDACYENGKVYVLPYGTSKAEDHCDASSGGGGGWGGWWGGWGGWGQTYDPVSDLGQVNRTAVVCSSASSLDTIGYYVGRVSQYRGTTWNNSISNNNIDDYVECETDQGIHGLATGNASVWAANSGPWSTVEANKVDWGSTGTSATLYSGRYINYKINAPIATNSTRIKIMQDVISQLLDATTGVNIGLMRFSTDAEGGMVATPVEDIRTNKAALKADLADMRASGGTPLSETFYEAAMYFQGKSVDYGNSSKPFYSVAGSKTGSAYKSPITDQCQKNYAILLTDGEPTSDSLSTTRRGKLNIGSCSGNCLDEIAKSIGTNDQNTSLDEDQFISTFTIGFAIDNDLLLDTANESYKATGVGERYLADDAASLADTLNNIFANIYETDTSFSSPAVSVNAFNRTVHLNDLYFTLFKPAIGNHWPGNLKKYKLKFYEDVDDTDKDGDTTERLPYIADVNSGLAVDEDTGFFASSSRSYWSAGIDGADVTLGGAANLFASGRKVFTYTGTYKDDNGVQIPLNTAVLSSTENVVGKSNTAISPAMLDISGEPDKISGTPLVETLLDWAAGIDVLDEDVDKNTTEMRLSMGDPLHSQPALIQYGGTEDNPDMVAYVATNDGYLQAFDIDTGIELFSFIPQELLPNLNSLMNDDLANKTYGLDGDVVASIYDQNADGEINGSDHVYLYVGMRRGGRNVYSLDVTNRNNPILRWVITGGQGDYAELGQTWSSINVEKIKDNGTETTVLIFGGGYDTNQDNVNIRTDDSVGRAVYIVNADSGKLMWSAGSNGNLKLTEMTYSIPARITPLDLSGDGFIDRLYTADMGGQIFRFDIDNNSGKSLTGSVTGGRIADFSADNSAADARRFYYPPDVALTAEKGKAGYLSLAITSGYRAHPNDTDIHDRIYLVKDKNVYNTPSVYKTLTESDLYDATLNLVAGDGDSSASDVAKAALDAAEGWYILLDDGTNTDTWIGEKGLSEALIINGVVIATTFTPVSASTVSNSCSPQSGTGKVFFLNTLDASPAFPASTDKRPERSRVLIKGGIPPTPNVIITKDREPTLCIGTECEPADISIGVRKTFWYEVEE